MNLTTLAPETRHFLEAEVAAGVYPSVESAIDAAVQRLRCDQEWASAAREGFQEIDAGLGRDYDDDSLADRFEGLRAVIRGGVQAADTHE